MLNLLPFPFNILANAVLSAILKWIVPLIKDPTIKALVVDAIQFLQTGNVTPPLASAAQAHAAAALAPKPA